jgi:small subunit ribosomal protein S6
VIRINPYEIMLMLDPELAEERHGEVIDRIKQIVEKASGTWGEVEPWGKRKLAYEIGHKAEAWYFVITFDAPPDALAEVTRVLAITDGVMRSMAVARVAGGATAPPSAATSEPVEAAVEA